MAGGLFCLNRKFLKLAGGDTHGLLEYPGEIIDISKTTSAGSLRDGHVQKKTFLCLLYPIVGQIRIRRHPVIILEQPCKIIF